MAGKMHKHPGLLTTSLLYTICILIAFLVGVSSVEARGVLGNARNSTLKLGNSIPQLKQPAVMKTSFKNEEKPEEKPAPISGVAGFQSWPLMHQLTEVVQKTTERFGVWWAGQDNAVAPFPPAPLMPIPNARQLAWQQGELSMFLHYGMNTYTDKEWGDGHESPELFNPEGLNATQWATVAKETGFKFLVIVAKHHDGFCAWPSKYTEHSVKNSPWKDGKGDVVREVADATRDVGVGFGIYLSPWDQNCSVYGDTRLYNEYYMGQLTELMTNYGPVVYNFYDGAKGSWGKAMQYHWDQIMTLNHQLQPGSAIFSDNGPDVRWVGNEGGWAGETNWATIDRKKVHIGANPPTPSYASEGEEGGPDYIPPECDTSIRPGWFYHREETPKSVDVLVGTYFTSVGRNGHLILNVPPNRAGVFDDADVRALHGFRKALDDIFSTDAASDSNVTASNVRGGSDSGPFGPPQVLTDDIRTYWATEDDVREATIELQMTANKTFNVVRLQEPIQLGQRISRHCVQVFDFHTRTWTTLVEGTTIGHKRLHTTEAVVTDKVRVRVFSARAPPLLASIGLHYSEHPVEEPPRVYGRARFGGSASDV